MKGIKSKKIIAVFIAIVMSASIFASMGTYNIAAALGTDNFEWNFSDGQGTFDNIAVETQNTVGAIPLQWSLHSAWSMSGNQTSQTPVSMLVDDRSSKWCLNVPSGTSSCWFVFDAGEPIYTEQYAIRSAEDCFAYDRFLNTWSVQGSNDALEWTDISPSANRATAGTSADAGDQGWTGDLQLRTFNFDNPSKIPYRYYRLDITRRGRNAGNAVAGGWMQCGYFGLVRDVPTVNYLTTYIDSGMQSHWAGSRPTMNGPNALRVGGNVGSADTGAKNYTTIKSGLEIEVDSNTKLGYMFAPEGRGSKDSNDYDYKYHSAHMAIDLKFSDGTRLSSLNGAKDQYGIGMNPNDQGKGKIHKTYQWNYVENELGKVAAGKTITDILVGFNMPDATPGHKVVGWFDDIKIWKDTRDYSKISPADFVDIRQGANVQGNATGAIFPSVNTPNAMQYMVPTTQRTSANKYEWQDSTMYGFTTSHVASRHMGERLTFLFMANSVTTSETNSNIQSAVDSAQARFSHANETAYQNYHYAVTFDPAVSGVTNNAPGVTMEITPTDSGAVLRFTFPEGAAARNIVFEAPHDTANNRSNMTPGEGNQVFTAWAQNGNDTSGSTGGNAALRRKHLYGEFSVQPSNFYVPAGTRMRSMSRFPELKNGPDNSTVIELRIATSWISESQAKKNFAMDLIDRDKDAPVGTWTTSEGKWFDTVKNEAKAEWNELLGQIKIEDPTANYWQLSNFYSKMARSHMYPTRLSEYTGNGSQGGWQYASPYRGQNATPTVMDGYMIFNEGWWDTFKSKWPLLRFLEPNASGQLTDGIIQHYIDQDGRGTSNGIDMNNMVGHSVPRWINPGGNNMMSGTSSDAIISDMFVNGIDFDSINGYRAWIKNSAVYSTSTSTGGRAGLEQSNFIGYRANVASSNNSNETTWSLEGYENDAAQAHMLKKMAADVDTTATIEGFSGEYWKQRWEDEAVYYENRAKQYTTTFNPAKGGWFRVRNANGTWRETDAAFNPLTWGGGYSEDNAWPYRVLVPHDGRGLGNLFGAIQGVSGPEALGNVLDEAFAAEGDDLYYPGADYGTYGYIHEVAEKREVKMGNFGMSNQPAYHMPWMYLHTDRPWNAQYWTRTALARAYSGEAIGYGYMGEEDNGAMSSWYVWSAMGLYPLESASGNLVIGSPAFRNMTITRDNGNKITINAQNNSFDNVYIQSMKVNGQDYHKTYLTLDILSQPNLTIDYVMGSNPNENWFTEAPPSLTSDENAPEIMMDLTNSSIPIVDGDITAKDTAQIAVTNINASGSNGATYLFDNSSTTSAANFSDNSASITYFNPSAKKIKMYTLTSSVTANTAPKVWKFSGSKDGEDWVTLDERSNEVFDWVRYTRPFAIDDSKQGYYKYYKLEITETSGTSLSLAQIEFLAEQPGLVVNPRIAKEDDKVTVNANITNNNASVKSANVYAAVYTAEGKLADLDIRDSINVPGLSSQAINSEIVLSISDAGDNYYVKVFLWDPDDLKVLADAVTLR